MSTGTQGCVHVQTPSQIGQQDVWGRRGQLQNMEEESRVEMELRFRASGPRQPRVFSLELPSNKTLYLLSGCTRPRGVCQRSPGVTFVCVKKRTSKDPSYSVIP